MTATVVLARLRRPWGRRGELIVDVHTDWPDERFAPGRVVRLAWDDGRAVAKTVRGFRDLVQGAMLAFEGVDDISAARDLAGAWVVGERDELGRPESDALTHADLAGLEVVRTDGTRVGRVAGVDETAGIDLLRVALDGGGEALVPLAPAICVAIEPEAGRIVIDPPVGLLDLSQADEA